MGVLEGVRERDRIEKWVNKSKCLWFFHKVTIKFSGHIGVVAVPV